MQRSFSLRRATAHEVRSRALLCLPWVSRKTAREREEKKKKNKGKSVEASMMMMMLQKGAIASFLPLSLLCPRLFHASFSCAT